MKATQFHKRLIKVFSLFVLFGLIISFPGQVLRAKAATETSHESGLQYGQIDSCDPEKLAASEELFLQLKQQDHDLPGTIWPEELQNEALQFLIESEKCYQQSQEEPPL